MVKLLTMRNMRGMQLAQPSDEACKNHGAIRQWYGIISRSKYEISSRGVWGPQENEEQNTTKRNNQECRAPKSE